MGLFFYRPIGLLCGWQMNWTDVLRENSRDHAFSCRGHSDLLRAEAVHHDIASTPSMTVLSRPVIMVKDTFNISTPLLGRLRLLLKINKSGWLCYDFVIIERFR